MIAVVTGAFLDWMLGDPYEWPHPVKAIGWLISKTEYVLRGLFPKSRQGETAAGVMLVAVVVGVTGLFTYGALAIAGMLRPSAQLVLASVMCYQALAMKSLKRESMKVCHALEAGDLEAARRAVSMIVGRDTGRLTEEGVTKAAVETVAENASDGVVAPLIFLVLFGPVGGFIYKAVNTMDSMVGYKNDRYIYFGRAAARLDDILNWIPSRLTALMLILGACVLPGYSGKGAWNMWRRDRRNHASPNSAQSESACAGALGVQLAGDAWYFGELHKKPHIGDPLRKIVPGDIRKVNGLMETTVLLTLACLIAVTYLFRFHVF